MIQTYDTEIPEDLPEEQALQLNVKDFACRSNAKAKPQRREPVDYSPSFIPMKGSGLILNQEITLSLSAYEISKKVIHLLRHSQQVQREEDGAVHFWRIKENLQSQFPQIPYWSDDRWKSCLAAGGGAKRIYQYCTDVPGTIMYLRALQGHSGRNLVDPLLQDNVVIQSGFFQHIYHIGCAFNLHSIINSGLIPGSQNSSKRQTVFFLPIDPRDESHKDPEKIDLNVPRRAQYSHSAWKKHQDAVYWVDIDLAIRKGLTFYQTRSNAIILQGTLPAYCIPKVVRLKTGEVLHEKAYMSPRLPPKDLFTSRLDKSWVQKLLDSHEKKLLDSHKKKFLDKQNSSNQPYQSQNQSVIDQGNLITNTKCLLIKAKHPGLKRSRRNLLTKNSVLQIDQGNLISRLA